MTSPEGLVLEKPPRLGWKRTKSLAFLQGDHPSTNARSVLVSRSELPQMFARFLFRILP